MECTVKLRIARREDFIQRVRFDSIPLDGKDFWHKRPDGTLDYYRLNTKAPETVKMIKDFLPLGEIYVVDVEGMEERWVKGMAS